MNPDRIQQILGDAKSKRIAVIGDLMLDRFVYGKVSRISPEAPVPVVEVVREANYPGGAANVARNLAPFCAESLICGRIGCDSYGSELEQLLIEEGIATSGLIRSEAVPTIVKTRIIARQQQVVRVDREIRSGAAVPVEAIVAQLAPRLEECDAVIFEDYGKGFLTQTLVDALMPVLKRKGIRVTVDPNPLNPLHWPGVDIIKPNRSEAFAAAGVPLVEGAAHPQSDPALAETGRRLLEKWRVPALLITLGEDGMMLFRAGREPYHTPTRAREVYDVSGAGDTAIALFTAALAAGASLEEAAEISNHASGVVVAKLGTATLTPEELRASFERD
ncbi:MAG TPA: PfkB family carbohydrate kinase [Chthoniobacterales bacterium]